MEEMSPPNLCPPKADGDPSPSQAEGPFLSHPLARHRGAPPDPGEPGGDPRSWRKAARAISWLSLTRC